MSAIVSTAAPRPKAPSDDHEHPVSLQKPLTHQVTFERRLGETEASYFLPSRENGVNDMYLHLGFKAPQHLIKRDRVCVVWAILRLRHPLLSSSVEMRDYEDIRFVYHPPPSVGEALSGADTNLEYMSLTKDELLELYLNGPRLLSNDRLSYLVVSQPRTSTLPTPPLTPQPIPEEQTAIAQFELFICAVHFLGDGMALHQFANDFLSLLGGPKTQSELETLLADEFQVLLKRRVDAASALPNALEDNFSKVGGRYRAAANRVDFIINNEKQIGGHAFPRKSGGTRHTVVPTVPFKPEETKAILKACKAHGVSISAALFALCNFAWGRTYKEKWTVPSMMYSALNLRPYFTVKPQNDSYWFLAISYFNVVLPTFLPTSGDAKQIFWHRASSAKQQSTKAARNLMVVSRSLETARERGRRALAWAKEDDDKMKGIYVPAAPTPKAEPMSRPPGPSAALIGLSLLGNLDGVYKHAAFPDIKLHTLTTGSRQRPGGMLLFGYTFAGKLWVSLGYDENGFDKEVVESFWGNFLGAIREFLL